MQHPADARLVADSCPGLGSFVRIDVPGLGSFVRVDVFVVDIVPMVMGMGLHACCQTLVPLAAANSLDAEGQVVMETSFVVDIAPMEGDMARIARSGLQAFGAEKRHRPETQTRDKDQRQTRGTDQKHRLETQTRDTSDTDQ